MVALKPSNSGPRQLIDHFINGIGHKRKYSARADVFRFAPERTYPHGPERSNAVTAPPCATAGTCLSRTDAAALCGAGACAAAARRTRRTRDCDGVMRLSPVVLGLRRRQLQHGVGALDLARRGWATVLIRLVFSSCAYSAATALHAFPSAL